MKAAFANFQKRGNEQLYKKTPSVIFYFSMPLLIALLSCTSGKALRKEKEQFASEGYRLVWADEFNINGTPDTANWQYEKGFVRNEEAQWYQTENTFCKNAWM